MMIEWITLIAINLLWLCGDPPRFLILDPHYTGREYIKTITDKVGTILKIHLILYILTCIYIVQWLRGGYSNHDINYYNAILLRANGVDGSQYLSGTQVHIITCVCRNDLTLLYNQYQTLFIFSIFFWYLQSDTRL